MSNETKRDVFDELLEISGNAMDQAMSAQYSSDENGCAPSGIGKAIRDILDPIEKRYDSALPDDLPVIPKAVGEYIERQKQGSTLRSAIIAASDFHAVDYEETEWLFYHSETFSRAWVLGVWRVEETGEIVKLEGKKNE